MAHTIAVAIAVTVNDDRLDYPTAAEFVRHAVTQAFTSPTGSYELAAYCQHDQHEVLFHEDGPCPPIGSDEYINAEKCVCGGFGYLTEQTYGRTDPGPDATLIQRCDECSKYPGDLDAAMAYAAAEAAHRVVPMEVHAIGDGGLMAPFSDAWVIEARPRTTQIIAEVIGPIWHHPASATRTGIYTWQGRCKHCQVDIAMLDSSPIGQEVWIDDDGGSMCAGQTDRYHEYEPEDQ